MDEVKEPLSTAEDEHAYHRMEHMMMVARAQHWEHVRIAHRIANKVMTWDEATQAEHDACALAEYEQTVPCLCHE